MSHILRALTVGKRHVAKAHGAHQHSRIIKWRGLTFGIENDIGTTRTGTGPEGAWSTTMQTPYGEIIGTRGVDNGDAIDIFVNEGGLDTCTHIYVVHTANPATGAYDEDKALAGFASVEEAVNCFASHYSEPHRHFGAVTQVPVDVFVRRCMEREQQGKSFTNDTEARVRLGQRRLARVRAGRADRNEWMQALVQKALEVRHVAKGLSYDEIEVKLDALEEKLREMDCELLAQEKAELDYQHSLLSYAKRASKPREVNKAVTMPGPDEDLYIRIWPGKNALDLQNEIIPVDLIYKSWAYYVECGNIDLEHISKMGGKSWREKADKIEAAGFDPHCSFARVQYEIGRPVRGSLRIEETDDEGNVTDFSFVAKIHGGDNEAAKWFRSTLPDIPWKPSVGGQMSSPIRVVSTINSPMLGIKNRKQEFAVARDFRWNNVGVTLESVNSYVSPVAVLSPEEVAELLGNVPAASA